MLFKPNNISGRFSVLTPYGIFFITLLGLDSKAIIKGSIDATNKLSLSNFIKNDAFKHSCYRHYLHTKKHVKVGNFIVYDPFMQMIGEIWKLLFCGQYLQEGPRIFFDTTLYIKNPSNDIVLKMIIMKLI